MNRFHQVAFGIILIFALNVPAQQTATAPGYAGSGEQGQPSMQDNVPSAEDQLKFLTSTLDLNDDQQARIKPILQRLHDATVAISQDQSLSRDERLSRVRPLRYKAHDQISEILNDQQKKKLEQYMQGAHPEMHGNLSGATSSSQPPQH
jgi:Spy/CpxP family protein refolding chaperone